MFCKSKNFYSRKSESFHPPDGRFHQSLWPTIAILLMVFLFLFQECDVFWSSWTYYTCSKKQTKNKKNVVDWARQTRWIQEAIWIRKGGSSHQPRRRYLFSKSRIWPAAYENIAPWEGNRNTTRGSAMVGPQLLIIDEIFCTEDETSCVSKIFALVKHNST